MQQSTALSGAHLGLREILNIAGSGQQISLTDDCRKRISRSRECLEEATSRGDRIVYGVNTGFGSLYNVRISEDATDRLQQNLIRSHAAGAGPLVPHDIARLTLLLKILSFCSGHSGVRLELVEHLVAMYNAGITPAIYKFGSLGASGDLAPLAHLAMAATGEGECITPDGEVVAAENALKEAGLEPLVLKAKEGLALINGTQFSCAYAIHALDSAHQLLDLANTCAALSFDAFNGNPRPYDAHIHDIRPHGGQRDVAQALRDLLAGSEIAVQGDKQLQDPYAFRCVPQVHGASQDAIGHCAQITEIEANSVTDNPLVFPDTGEVLSGGNFHGQPLALAMDYLAIALAELGSISERRTYQLLSGTRGLPDYLTVEAGVQSGLMIAQYTAASIVNRNKILCTPASIDSIPTSKGQEDHVSMSANAATKVHEICENLYMILAIEFLTSSRALTFRKPAKTSPTLLRMLEEYRKVVPVQEADETIAPLIRKTVAFMQGLKG